jgi:hypothetical protein
VVRKDREGNFSVYHSQRRIPVGKKLSSRVVFEANFNTEEFRTSEMALLNNNSNPGVWNFAWSSPNANPTYSYYNSSYDFRYNYVYYPYYTYYDSHGASYSYYNWRW